MNFLLKITDPTLAARETKLREEVASQERTIANCQSVIARCAEEMQAVQKEAMLKGCCIAEFVPSEEERLIRGIN